jgi:hypothetical protein
MKKTINAVSFLAIGKTQESKETQEFKRYVGLASSYVLAVNPSKKELDELRGFESQAEPEYIKEGENGKEAHINFLVKVVPEANNGIEFTSQLMFTLRQAPAYNKDETKVQVIDQYGNTTWANTEDAKAGKKLLSANGSELKIDGKYRMACVGEADLVGFLKKYLCIGDAFNYVNGSWILKDNASECVFALEHIKEYFKGDFKELKEALALQPNNKVKLLYGVRTTDDGKQYQTVAAREDLILHNNAGNTAIAKLEGRLAEMKNNGSYSNTEFKVQELAEYDVQPTNLETASGTKGSEDAGSDNQMPWDM